MDNQHKSGVDQTILRKRRQLGTWRRLICAICAVVLVLTTCVGCTSYVTTDVFDSLKRELTEEIHALQGSNDAALAEIAAGGVKVANGVYTGDGATTVQLNVGFNPKFLIICGPDPDYRMMYLEGMTSVYTYVKRGATTAYSYAVTVANGTVSWGTNSERSYFLNADGTKYFWFAVG